MNDVTFLNIQYLPLCEGNMICSPKAVEVNYPAG